MNKVEKFFFMLGGILAVMTVGWVTYEGFFVLTDDNASARSFAMSVLVAMFGNFAYWFMFVWIGILKEIKDK